MFVESFKLYVVVCREIESFFSCVRASLSAAVSEQWKECVWTEMTHNLLFTDEDLLPVDGVGTGYKISVWP